jgi:hypothetical protein
MQLTKFHSHEGWCGTKCLKKIIGGLEACIKSEKDNSSNKKLSTVSNAAPRVCNAPTGPVRLKPTIASVGRSCARAQPIQTGTSLSKPRLREEGGPPL